MIPPTSIDGTDITGATIDGQDVQEITVDGDTVFTAGPLIIDDFEDGNLSEYSGDFTSFQIESSNPISGSHSLRITPDSGQEAIRTNTLANLPVQGDDFEFKFKILSLNQGGFVNFAGSSNFNPFISGDGLFINPRVGADYLRIGHQTAGNPTTTTASYSYDLNTIYKCEVRSGSTLDVRLFEAGTQVVSATLSTPSFSGSFFGFTDGGGGVADSLYDDFQFL